MLCLCLQINAPLSEAVELMIDRLHSPKNEAKPPKKIDIFRKLTIVAAQEMHMHNVIIQTNG